MVRSYGAVQHDGDGGDGERQALVAGRSNSSGSIRVSKTALAIGAVCVVAVAVAVGVLAGVHIGKASQQHPASSRSLASSMPPAGTVMFDSRDPVGKKEREMVYSEGELRQCVEGRHHNTTYSTYGYSESHFYDLDSSHIKKVKCDLDQTNLYIQFHSMADALEWYAKLEFEDYFITGGSKWHCKHQNRTQSIVRRVLSAEVHDSTTVKVHALPAQYSELWDTADIAYASGGSCSAAADSSALGGLDKRICLGFNTDCKHGVDQPNLPLVQGPLVTVTCKECFFGFTAEVFLEVHISGWAMVKMASGFRNMTAEGSMVLGVDAEKDWSAGIDRVFELVSDTTVLAFQVGPVPFRVFFDVPLEASAQLSATVHAEAELGVKANWTLGDQYIEWDAKTHWHHVSSTRKASHSTIFSAEADFDAQADFSLSPTLNMHVDNVYTYRLQFVPDVHMEVKAGTATKQVCADATYDLDAKAMSEISINIPFLNMADDWEWSKDLWTDSGVIAHRCEAVP